MNDQMKERQPVGVKDGEAPRVISMDEYQKLVTPVWLRGREESKQAIGGQIRGEKQERRAAKKLGKLFRKIAPAVIATTIAVEGAVKAKEVYAEQPPAISERLEQTGEGTEVTPLPDAGLTAGELASLESGQLVVEPGSELDKLVESLELKLPEGGSLKVVYSADEEGGGSMTALPFIELTEAGRIDEIDLKAGSIVFVTGVDESGAPTYGYLEPVEVEGYGETKPMFKTMSLELADYISTLKTAGGGAIGAPDVGEWVAMTAVGDPGNEGFVIPVTIVGRDGEEAIAIVISSVMAGEPEAPATPEPEVRDVLMGGEVAGQDSSAIIEAEGLSLISQELSSLPGREGGEQVNYTSGIEAMIDGKNFTLLTDIPGLNFRDMDTEYFKAVLDLANLELRDGDVVRFLRSDGTYEGIDVIDPIFESSVPGDYGQVIARVQNVEGRQIYTVHLSDQNMKDYNTVYPIDCAELNLDPAVCVDREGNQVEVVEYDNLKANVSTLVVAALMQDGWFNRINGPIGKARTEIHPYVMIYMIDFEYPR